MNAIHSFKVLREIKHQYGLSETSPLAAWIRELVSTYNESYEKYGIIAHTQANIYTQKVRHDSFSEALNRTILNLEALISNDCFPSSNCEHSHLSKPNSHHSSPAAATPGSAEKQAVIYRHGNSRHSKWGPLKGVPHKKQVKQRKKRWGDLIQDSLLLDLYKTYVAATGDTRLRPNSDAPAPAHAFINAVLQHITHSTTEPTLRLQPPIQQLTASAFRSIVKHYRALCS